MQQSWQQRVQSLAVACVCAVAGGIACTLDRAPTASTPAGWRLTWSDEFDASDGSPYDRSRWVAETGGAGWGNNELETYTDRPINARIEGGMLVIRALKESFRGSDGISREYTSARLKTQGLFAQAYGRFEARIKLPRGQGIWPAFWMLGDDIARTGWPTCGEIDVMENIGREPSIVHGTIHGPGYSGAQGIGAPFGNTSGRAFADDFHIFAVEWTSDGIRWEVDGQAYQTRTARDLPAGARWVFDHPFFILLNVAIGGNWPGAPDGSTTFPQEMRVDYVRVYSRQ